MTILYLQYKSLYLEKYLYIETGPVTVLCVILCHKLIMSTIFYANLVYRILKTEGSDIFLNFIVNPWENVKIAWHILPW